MEKQHDISQSYATTLYEAALKGDKTSLGELLKNDEFILDRCIIEKSCIFMQSPLHVAVKKGHLDFVKEILRLKPELAEVVDQLKRSSPLHIAAARKEGAGLAEPAVHDHDENIIDILLKTAPNMCFVHDQDGMTPLHVAAVNGNTEVLIEFLEKKRQAALERTTRGETILHLCVKNCQVETLKALVEITYDLELLNSQDSDGNTVLHLAVAYKEVKMVEFLLGKGDKIDKNAMNKKHQTIMDIFELTKCREVSKDIKTDEVSDADTKIEKLLKAKHASRAKKVLKRSEDEKWLEQQNTALMVVASCIATLSFQVGINPPGGVWQDDNKGHEAGTSIMSYDKDKDSYNIVQVSNTIGLMSSLSVILLLISGLPCKRFFVFILRVTLWIAVTASATTYLYTIGFLTNDIFDKTGLLEDALDYSVEIWLWLMLVILFGHGLRLIWKAIGHKKRRKIRGVLERAQRSRYCPNINNA
ncbi:ankyrin repeat-containing protein ITN1-like [Chenopodium quinoa]|uniref:PGG domain-containing protein n=1 Tax=Chenopodium quinoa TaxID=63459 RepID=A0A803LBL6_CHEQI|nr:ankyrin repeat-containing protein ITN1-like [Chenopodium quinoa]